jgi:hypothetical protein
MNLIKQAGKRTRVGLTLAAAVALVATSSAVAVAVSRDDKTARHSADAALAKVASPRITGQTSAGGCKAGYDTETGTIIPPDDSTTDNTAAATVVLTKGCVGAVVATFTSEVSAPNSGDFIHIDMRATCTATAGQTSPCTVGQQVFAAPGHTFFQNGSVAYGTHAMTMVWTGLARGQWTIQVLPGGNNSANLQFRTLSVVAYKGG